jgi:hypothetical protein
VTSRSQGRYLTQAQKHTETSIPWVGFEPTIPAFKRAKTVHALDSGHCDLLVNYRVSMNTKQ